MKGFRMRAFMSLAIACILSLVTACSGTGNGGGNQSAVGNNEKAANDNGTAKKTVDEQVNEGKLVTLQVFQSSAGITDSEFEELYAKPVKSKYPNVTLELIRESKASINQLMTAGEFPDIIFTPTLNLIKFYRRAVGAGPYRFCPKIQHRFEPIR